MTCQQCCSDHWYRHPSKSQQLHHSVNKIAHKCLSKLEQSDGLQTHTVMCGISLTSHCFSVARRILRTFRLQCYFSPDKSNEVDFKVEVCLILRSTFSKNDGMCASCDLAYIGRCIVLLKSRTMGIRVVAGT